jgi:hypothetical protein
MTYRSSLIYQQQAPPKPCYLANEGPKAVKNIILVELSGPTQKRNGGAQAPDALLISNPPHGAIAPTGQYGGHGKVFQYDGASKYLQSALLRTIDVV